MWGKHTNIYAHILEERFEQAGDKNMTFLHKVKYFILIKHYNTVYIH